MDPSTQTKVHRFPFQSRSDLRLVVLDCAGDGEEIGLDGIEQWLSQTCATISFNLLSVHFILSTEVEYYLTDTRG